MMVTITVVDHREEMYEFNRCLKAFMAMYVVYYYCKIVLILTDTKYLYVML